MATLNFTAKQTHQLPIRNRPSKYAKSPIRPRFEVSEGIRPAEVMYPWKYLPVGFQDTDTEDWVVIPKGRIVSAISMADYLLYGSAASSGSIDTINASGTIPITTSQTTSTVLTANIDSNYFGYDEQVAGLLVPCNGGNDVAYEYDANDVTAGTFRTGNVAAASGDTASVSGNLPLGVAYSDIYQDIRGLYLNYTQWDKWQILCDWYIEIPFVRVDGTTFTTDPSGYKELREAYTYMTLKQNDLFVAGMPVMADQYGNYVMEQASSSTITPSGLLNGANYFGGTSIHTIGRLWVADSRFPKDMLEVVDTYPGSTMPGTDTGGLPSYLFNLAHQYAVSAGKNHRISDIINYVKDGQFGVARIQLSL